jgi:hypothetical protein
MELVDVSFRTGIDLSLQRLPTGDGYLLLEDAGRVLAKAEAVIDGVDDAEFARSAAAMIKVSQDNVRKGQSQLFLQKASYAKKPAHIVDRLFEILRAAQG